MKVIGEQEAAIFLARVNSVQPIFYSVFASHLATVGNKMYYPQKNNHKSFVPEIHKNSSFYYNILPPCINGLLFLLQSFRRIHLSTTIFIFKNSAEVICNRVILHGVIPTRLVHQACSTSHHQDASMS